MNIKAILFGLLIIIGSLTYHLYAQDKLFNQVVAKFKQDEQSFEQFQYLATLHCLDSTVQLDENHHSKGDSLFVSTSAFLFNETFAFPRLIDYEILDKVLTDFEQKNLPKRAMQDLDNPRFINHIEQCQNLYSENTARPLYENIVGNWRNYYQSEDSDEEEFNKKNMEDYLKFGRIDYHRFLP